MHVSLAHSSNPSSAPTRIIETIQYWGEGGFFRVKAGKNILGIEDGVAWVTPGAWTTKNVACSEDGKTCGGVKNHGGESQEYVDPSLYLLAKE